MATNSYQSKKKFLPQKYPCLGLILGAAIGLFPLFNREITQTLFVHTGYYFMLSAFSFFGVQVYQYANQKIRDDKKKVQNLRTSLFIALAIAGVVFISHPVGMKLNSDEARLALVSRSFFEHKTSYLSSIGFNFSENFHPQVSVIPTRPLMFSFLTSIFHFFTGYSFYSSIALNFIILLCFYTLLIHQGSNYLGRYSGMALGILTMSIPGLNIYATSGGFDLAAAVFLIFTCWVYLKCPARQNLLISCLILLMHLRYESIIFSSILLASALLSRRYSFDRKKYFFSFLFFSFQSSLIFWQRWLTPNQYNDQSTGKTFSLDFFLNNFETFSKSVFTEGALSPFNNVILISALISLVFLVGNFKQYKIAFPIVLVVGTHFCLMLAFHSGLWEHPSTSRYFLLENLSAVLLVGVLAKRIRKIHIHQKHFLIGSLVLLFYFFPKGITHRFMNILETYRQSKTIERILQPENKNIVVIHQWPEVFAAHDYGAVTHDYAKENWATLQNYLNIGLIDKIITVETLPNHNPSQYREKKGFRNKTRFLFSSTHQTVISEVSRSK